MYSDRIAAGGAVNRKRSIKERLGGNAEIIDQPARQTLGKRFRQDDGKWQHDMYEDELDKGSVVKKEQASTQDLRLKLNKSLLKGSQGGNGTTSSVKDLREKLSGPVQPIPTVTVAQRRISSTAKESPSGATAVTGSKPVTTKASDTQKTPAVDVKMQVARNSPADVLTVSGLLQSLGLSKYLITFQAEEIDMSVLRHMSDDDLKELGIPMGPRKKILLALASQLKR